MNKALWILASSIHMMRHICTMQDLDYMFIDLEHSSYSYSELISLIEIIRSHQKRSCIRLAGLQRELILHSIELNPDTIMIPSISKSDQVARAIDYFYTLPVGSRGFSPYTYHSINATKTSKIIKTELCLQLESKEALERISIFNRPGLVNSVFVGRYDLARSCGEDMESPGFMSLLCQISIELKSYGLTTGTVCLNQEEYSQLSDCYDFVSIGSDVTRMLESSRPFMI